MRHALRNHRDDQPCLTYRRVISLVVQVNAAALESTFHTTISALMDDKLGVYNQVRGGDPRYDKHNSLRLIAYCGSFMSSPSILLCSACWALLLFMSSVAATL